MREKRERGKERERERGDKNALLSLVMIRYCLVNRSFIDCNARISGRRYSEARRGKIPIVLV